MRFTGGLLLFFVALSQHVLLAKKSILDYDDSDIERLSQQWEEDDEKDEEGPPHHHQNPEQLMDMMKDGKVDPQNLMKQSKKGKPVMIFVGVRDAVDNQPYTEQVSSRWMNSLHNAHIPVQRYIVAPDRVLFMVEDGSLAWDIKDYLTTLTDCTTVSFDQLSFDCKDYKKDEL